MPFEVQLEDSSPIGYTAYTVREGEEAAIVVREFLSSEDGNFFIGRLEGFVSPILSKLPDGPLISPALIDHFLAVIKPDRRATIYVNELDLTTGTKVQSNVRG